MFESFKDNWVFSVFFLLGLYLIALRCSFGEIAVLFLCKVCSMIRELAILCMSENGVKYMYELLSTLFMAKSLATRQEENFCNFQAFYLGILGACYCKEGITQRKSTV